MKKLERIANLPKGEMEEQVVEAYNNRKKVEQRQKKIEKLIVFLFLAGMVGWFVLLIGLGVFLKN